MTKLIALAAILAASAEGIAAGLTADLPEGAAFEFPPDQAEPLLTAGLAKLADAPLAGAAPPVKSKTVRVRVLMDCVHGPADAVVTLDAEVAKAAVELGQVDANKAAVAYALTLPQNQ